MVVWVIVGCITSSVILHERATLGQRVDQLQLMRNHTIGKKERSVKKKDLKKNQEFLAKKDNPLEVINTLIYTQMKILKEQFMV